MQTTRVLLLAALLSVCLVAQTSSSSPSPVIRLYATYSEATPSTSAYVVTVQQPAASPRQITFEGAMVYCSVACNPTLEINGGVATTTAGTAIKLDTRAPAATSGVFTSANGSAGTVVGKYVVAAGQNFPILASGLTLGSTAAARQNLTIRTDSITGSVHVLLMWSERQ